MYILTEPWGHIHKIMVYSGQGCDVSDGMCHTEYVVEKLMFGLLYKGRSLYIDNFYNSVQLSKKLLKKVTYTTGTLKSNRKNNPKDVINKKLKKGEYICMYTKEGICVLKWKDKRDVLMISSEFPYSMCEVNTIKEIKEKPISVLKYNKNMSGIDRQDQMSAYYPFKSKSMRWYKKIGLHFLHLLLLNSYFLYNKHVKKISLYEYRLSIIQNVLPSNQNILNSTQKIKKPDEFHLPKKVLKNEKKRYLYKRCKICYETGIRKDTTYYCEQCNDQPGLCLEKCFEMYHKQI